MENKQERIAKIIARSGVCSRRDAEKLIAEGKVSYKGKLVESPAEKFESTDGILVNGKPIKQKKTKLWIYHKPVGLIVSHHDEQHRETIFENVRLGERVISAGRLDKNTSGLLLLSNDGELVRKLELPQNNFKRIYLVRVFGFLDFENLKKALSKSITIEGITYKPVEVELQNSSNANHWLRLTISEGKNREIRNIMNYFNLNINRLIRIQYGNFELGDLKPGETREISNWSEYIS